MPKLIAPSPSTVHPGGTAYMDGALTLFPETFDLATGLYTMIHVVSHSSELSNSRTALTTPPLHVHRYQTEIFNVRRGRMRYLCDGVEGIARAGESQVMKPGHPHTFWPDSTAGEDLEVAISVTEGRFEEPFLRSFMGYLNSCYIAKAQPNPLQMLVFLDSADVYLAEPPLRLGLVLGFAARWVGWALGYQSRYKVFEV